MKHFVGSIVVPISYDYVLACGSGIYNHAIVVSVNPFVLISEEGDMMWDTDPHPEGYRSIGTAAPSVKKAAFARWKREKERVLIDYQNDQLRKKFFARVRDKIARVDLNGFERAVNLLKRKKDNG